MAETAPQTNGEVEGPEAELYELNAVNALERAILNGRDVQQVLGESGQPVAEEWYDRHDHMGG